MRTLFQLLTLTIGCFSVACGDGEGRDDLGPPVIIQTANLIASKTIDTFETVEGTEIHGEGIAEGPFTLCGHIQSISAYRTETELVFRIEEALGFCWANDNYRIRIGALTWRRVPSAIILSNIGDPMAGTRAQAIVQQVTGVSVDEALTARQWMDNEDDAFFYMAIPLEVFQFFTDVDDQKSVFPVDAQIVRFFPDIANATAFGVVDGTDFVNVDFVDPE